MRNEDNPLIPGSRADREYQEQVIDTSSTMSSADAMNPAVNPLIPGGKADKRATEVENYDPMLDKKVNPLLLGAEPGPFLPVPDIEPGQLLPLADGIGLRHTVSAGYALILNGKHHYGIDKDQIDMRNVEGSVAKIIKDSRRPGT